MNRLAVHERAPGGPVATDWPLLQIDPYRAVMRAEAQVVAVLQEHDGIIGLAKLARAFDDGFENRRDVGWRGSDHAEDVAASGLVSQRFREFARLRLHLLEQSRIFDRDHRLVGEGSQQLDMMVGESAGLDARHRNEA